MKQIILERLTLKNFKGIRDLSIDFDAKETNIHGANGTGKTSLFDAFTWLLFDKDGSGSAQFNIKTLDENNNPIHQLDHLVSGLFAIDGKKVELKKIYREKWTTKRGEANEVFSGHETTYYYNDAPVQKKDFQERVNEIVTEDMFKVLTSPLHFNQINWKERREMLLKMAGEINDQTIIDSLPTEMKPEALREILSQDKSFIDELASIRAKKKQLKEDLKQLPSRIDEVNSSKSEPIDEAEINEAIKTAESIIEQKQNELSNISERNRANQQLMVDYDNKRFEVKSRIEQVQREIKSLELSFSDSQKECLRRLNDELIECMDKRDSLLRIKQVKQNEIDELERTNKRLREDFKKISESVFVEPSNGKNCSSCGQELKDFESNIEKLRLSFNENKDAQIKDIQSKGLANKTKIEALQLELSELDKQTKEVQALISETQNVVNAEKNKIESNQTFTAPKELTDKINSLDVELSEIKSPELPDLSTNESAQIQLEIKQQNDLISDLKKQLYVNESNAKADARIIELQGQQRIWANKLSELEGVEYAIEQFDKAKMDLVETRVNRLFSVVKFKMFEEQINGGLNPVCDCLINGVPFSDLNTASKINAGIDIINSLKVYFEISCPVIIDNRESVTNILDNQLQIVNLVVDSTAKKITIK